MTKKKILKKGADNKKNVKDKVYDINPTNNYTL